MTQWYSLLVLSGMGLIFFVVTSMELCFGFVIKQC